MNITFQGAGTDTQEAQEYYSWQLLTQPSEGADIITEGIHIVTYLSIHSHMHTYVTHTHAHFQNNILPCITKKHPGRY